MVNGISHLNGSAGNHSLALVQIAGQRIAFDVVGEGVTRRWSTRQRKEDGAFPLAGQILEEVNNLARDFEPEAGPMAVVIDGDGGASELVSELKKSTDRPVRRLETDATRIPSTDFIGAFGLALRGQVDLPMSANLLPLEYRSKKSKSGYYLMIGLGVLLLLAIGGWGGSKMIRRQIVLDRLQVELTHLQKEVRHVDAVAAEIGETEKRIGFIDNVVNTYVPASDILNELSTRIPNSAWVKTLDLSNGALKIHGEARSASDLLTRLEASPMFRDVRFLSTINKTDDGRENYKIGMKLAE
jgi:Tfp pilus assembly protein PilN